MKYKVGDKVRVRADLDVNKMYGGQDFIDDMVKYCGEVMEIEEVGRNDYTLKEDDENWHFTDEMFEE